MDAKMKENFLAVQKNEITEHIVYHRLSRIVGANEHAQVLKRISDEELKHYGVFKEITGRDQRPDRLKIFFYIFLSRIFGLNFGLRLMESGEGLAQETYNRMIQAYPVIEAVLHEEKRHEKELIGLIDEERLQYVSSVVLGLNDALVELTGALAGFTLAIQNTRLIGIVGMITGIAASMSMAASEYLSTKQEETKKSPLKASVYTGMAYVGTVLLLVSPYLIFENMFLCLGMAILNGLLVILIFTFYISVAKELNFKKRFFEMAGLSVSIAAINFVIGMIIRKVFGVEV